MMYFGHNFLCRHQKNLKFYWVIELKNLSNFHVEQSFKFQCLMGFPGRLQFWPKFPEIVYMPNLGFGWFGLMAAASHVPCMEGGQVAALGRPPPLRWRAGEGVKSLRFSDLAILWPFWEAFPPFPPFLPFSKLVL